MIVCLVVIPDFRGIARSNQATARMLGLTAPDKPLATADESSSYYNPCTSFVAVHESESGTRLPIWNVQIESVGIGLMHRDHGLVGFWRVPSRAHRLVFSGTCRICSHTV
jgi:hypothetical protein